MTWVLSRATFQILYGNPLKTHFPMKFPVDWCWWKIVTETRVHRTVLCHRVQTRILLKVCFGTHSRGCIYISNWISFERSIEWIQEFFKPLLKHCMFSQVFFPYFGKNENHNICRALNDTGHCANWLLNGIQLVYVEREKDSKIYVFHSKQS